MSNFELMGTSKIVKSVEGDILIKKYKKSGTSRIFWTPEIGGLRISRTMFGAMNEAVSLAIQYAEFKAS